MVLLPQWCWSIMINQTKGASTLNINEEKLVSQRGSQKPKDFFRSSNHVNLWFVKPGWWFSYRMFLQNGEHFPLKWYAPIQQPRCLSIQGWYSSLPSGVIWNTPMDNHRNNDWMNVTYGLKPMTTYVQLDTCPWLTLMFPIRPCSSVSHHTLCFHHWSVISIDSRRLLGKNPR